jgi:uncharacterized protein (TIGR00251 family)
LKGDATPGRDERHNAAAILVLTPEQRGGVKLRLRVSAGAAKTRVLGVHAGALKLSVGTAPEKGKANREVLALVARVFSLPRRGAELVSGETSRDKVVRLALTPEEAARRWAGRAGQPAMG